MKTARRVCTCLLLTLALLIVVPTPNMWLWRLAIVASEFGHWLVVLALALFAIEVRRANRHWRRAAPWLALNLATAGLFLSPLTRAVVVARALPVEFERAFPSGYWDGEQPLKWRTLWSLQGDHCACRTYDFAAADGTPLPFDLYPAATPGRAPFVLVIHSGGWNNHDRTDLRDLNFRLPQSGCAVVAMTYRLAPDAHWPAPREDAIALLRHLEGRQDELGLDTSRVILLGRSAGGQIALATACANMWPGVRGVISFYGVTDMEYAYQKTTPDDFLHGRKLIREYLNGTPDEIPDRYGDASPLLAVSEKTPPALLIHGGHDPLVWQIHSRRFVEALTAKHVPHFLLDLPWATHAFDYTLRGPGGQLSTWAVERFVKVVTGNSSGTAAQPPPPRPPRT